MRSLPRPGLATIPLTGGNLAAASTTRSVTRPSAWPLSSCILLPSIALKYGIGYSRDKAKKKPSEEGILITRSRNDYIKAGPLPHEAARVRSLPLELFVCLICHSRPFGPYTRFQLRKHQVR